jgi:hypothetical protein
VAVLNGERETEPAVLGPELSLEVSGPGAVGFWEDGNRRTRVGSTTAPLLRFHAALTKQDAADGIGARGGLEPRILKDLLPDLAGTPAALVADLEDTSYDGRRGCMSAGVWPVRAVLQAIQPLGLIPLDPSVTGRSGDVVATAELGVREIGELSLEDESGAFSLHSGGSPRHRALPVEGAPRLRGEL